MKLISVVEDCGDGSVCIRHFESTDEAQAWVKANEEWCYEGYDVETFTLTDEGILCPMQGFQEEDED